MSKGGKISKYWVFWVCLPCGIGIVAELYFLFSLKDWSHHRFEVLGYILKCLILSYVMYYFIKRRDKGEDGNIDKKG